MPILESSQSLKWMMKTDLIGEERRAAALICCSSSLYEEISPTGPEMEFSEAQERVYYILPPFP